MNGSVHEQRAHMNARLKNLLLRHITTPGLHPTAITGLTLVRRETGNSSSNCFNKPLVAFFVQGQKHTCIANREYTIHEQQCLVTAIDMPSASYVINPSSDYPFLSLFLDLDKQILTDLILQMDACHDKFDQPLQGISIQDSDPEVLECVIRLIELIEKPQQIALRSPLILQELHYLLLAGPQGKDSVSGGR